MSTSPAFVSGPRSTGVNIANADGTSYKSLFVAGASGSRIDFASVSNSDAANVYVVQVALKIGATDYLLGEVTVPAGAGSNGSTKSVSLLDSAALPALANTLNIVFLGASCELRVRTKSAVAGSNTLTFVACGGDY